MYKSVLGFLSIAPSPFLRLLIKVKVLLTQSVKVYWWKHPEFPNFGDELGAEIIEKLFKIKCICSPTRQEAELLAIGSILNESHGGEEPGGRYFIWGSGFNYPDFIPTRNWLKVCAVRGEITRDRLKVKNVALGDPGLLANLVYTRSKSEGKIGIIPHYSELSSPDVEKFRNDAHFLVISPARMPSEVVKDITKCKVVFSSSMHGLIVADSFSIPNVHFQLSSKVEGGDLKYLDYYSAINKVHRKITDANKPLDPQYVEHIISTYQRVENLEKIQEDLIISFPFRNRMGGGA